MDLHSKKDFRDLLLKIERPLITLYTKEKAGLVLGSTKAAYGQHTIKMEAFSRQLWGLVPFWSGGGNDPVFEEIYRKGLTAGTNPESEEYWGGFWDGDQRFVEMAAIAYGLIMAPEKLWIPLSEQEQDNLAKWLEGINHYQLPHCNWVFFAILVNMALKKCNKPYSQDKMDYYLELAEDYYLGEGWYQDGDSEQKDYYISFAMHFYSLLYARVMEREDPVRSHLFKERAVVFGRQFIYWFDEEGAAIPYGRSMTYRFAQVSFFSACLMAGVYPFSVGQMKGLIVRHLQYWMEKPIFDRDEILTIGYGYQNLIMSEIYNAPGSPYWALKTFAVLMLPDEHPFWEAKAEVMPNLETQITLSYAEMLIRRYPHHTTAFVPGKHSRNDLGHATEKYGKFAYDTRFPFHVSKSAYTLRDASPDSMLAFLIDDMVYVRRNCKEYQITDENVVSVWSPFPGIIVKTTITPKKEGHIRIHQIESAKECLAYDCGFAVEADIPLEETVERADNAMAKNADAVCEVMLMEGDGVGTIIDAAPNTNLMYPMSKIPAICYQITKGKTKIVTRVRAEVL